MRTFLSGLSFLVAGIFFLLCSMSVLGIINLIDGDVGDIEDVLLLSVLSVWMVLGCAASGLNGLFLADRLPDSRGVKFLSHLFNLLLLLPSVTLFLMGVSIKSEVIRIEERYFLGVLILVVGTSYVMLMIGRRFK